ncbi:MAG: MraY family glycosyltransferase [Phycisphaerales bacterium]|nr:undecaprenyl/decaprenyl-phosphate alpha-N-acetylglucosaminyl 1-phosphate transferase [Planctomycetota bacterium]
MTGLCLLLIPLAALLSAPLCAMLVHLGHRLRTFDSPGVAGQIKDPPRRVPNTGGIAIYWAITLPLVACIALALWTPDLLPPAAAPQVAYIRAKMSLALVLLGGISTLHIMGLIDDRRPLRALPKLILMVAPALAAPLFTDTRLFTFLDAPTGGAWLSILLTTAWFLAVTNAMNFLDNMDGLSAGIAAIAASAMLAITIQKHQWLLAGTLALLIGACLGFLLFNAPRRSGAKLFMGDGGSLVLGYLLAFVTVRITYYDPGTSQSSGWHAVFMPLVVLAIPLYDLVVVTSMRLWQRKSPFLGDTNHVSHRLTRRGLTRAQSVYFLWGMTVFTGLAGLALAESSAPAALAIGAAVATLLAVLAVFEFWSGSDHNLSGRRENAPT